MSTPSRRELNRTRTRDALLEATRTVTAEHGIDAATIEQIAEHAGVSRRTFFNYFPSVDAALAEAVMSSIAGVADIYLARPAEEDPLTAVIESLQEAPFDQEFLGWIVSISCHGAALPPRAAQLWRHHRDWVAELIGQRVGADPSSLYCSTLGGTVMSVFEASEVLWLETLPRTTLTADDVAEFNDLIRTGLAMARAGWQHPAPAADGAPPAHP